MGGGTTKRERECLGELAEQVREGVIVEIGSFKGGSTIYLAKGASKSNKKVYAVDPHVGGTKNAFLDNIRKAKCEDAIITLDMTSRDAAKVWSKAIGLLFIDGLHDYGNVKRDFVLWTKYLVHGEGIVALHDIWSLGVARAVYENLKPNHFSDLHICQSIMWATASPVCTFREEFRHRLLLTLALLIACSKRRSGFDTIIRRFGWRFQFYKVLKKLVPPL